MNYPTIIRDRPIKTPLEKDIRLLAYYLYLRHGRGDGHAVDDWLEAELDLQGQVRVLADGANQVSLS